MNWIDMKKSELLKLPIRKWDDTDKVYNCILIVPTRLKHDSGYACIALIGCVNNEPIEICAFPDDVLLPKQTFKEHELSFRVDASYPSGVLSLWHGRYDFRVGMAVSSTEIYAVPKSGGCVNEERQEQTSP